MPTVTLSRVSKCHGLTVVWPRKIFWLSAKSWDLYAQPKNVGILTSFTVFSSWFTYIMWFLHFFLRKISKLKFWPLKKSTFRMSDSLLQVSKCFLTENTALIKPQCPLASCMLSCSFTKSHYRMAFPCLNIP